MFHSKSALKVTCGSHLAQYMAHFPCQQSALRSDLAFAIRIRGYTGVALCNNCFVAGLMNAVSTLNAYDMHAHHQILLKALALQWVRDIQSGG